MSVFLKKMSKFDKDAWFLIGKEHIEGKGNIKNAHVFTGKYNIITDYHLDVDSTSLCGNRSLKSKTNTDDAIFANHNEKEFCLRATEEQFAEKINICGGCMGHFFADEED